MFSGEASSNATAISKLNNLCLATINQQIAQIMQLDEDIVMEAMRRLGLRNVFTATEPLAAG